MVDCAFQVVHCRRVQCIEAHTDTCTQACTNIHTHTHTLTHTRTHTHICSDTHCASLSHDLCDMSPLPSPLCSLLVLRGEDGSKIPLYSIFIDPSNSNQFAVSGMDQFARIFDRRQAKGRNEKTDTVKNFCPDHLVRFALNHPCAVHENTLSVCSLIPRPSLRMSLVARIQ